MNIACGVVTHNPSSKDRFRLLRQTIHSLSVAFKDSPIYLLDNDSQDSSPTDIRVAFGSKANVKLQFVRHPDSNHTPGRGRNFLLDWMMADQEGIADVFVMSDDDMLWHDDACEKLEAIYSAPPETGREPTTWNEQVALVCGYLEPNYRWSTVRGRAEPGGVPVIFRDSVPGAAFTFRVRPTKDWPVVGIACSYKNRRPGWPVFKEGFGYDSDLCRQMSSVGLRVAATDLCDHLGVGRSTHGNEPSLGTVLPLDRAKWRI